MFEVYRKEITWGDKLLTFETGKIARQADGAVIASCGETVVLATAVAVFLPVLIANLLRKRCRPIQMIVIGPLNVNDR